jgi:hypothetical protein
MKVSDCPCCGVVLHTELIDSKLFYTDYAISTPWKRESHVDTLVSVLRHAA